MPKQYARFAAAPIGAGLVAKDSGLTVTTAAANAAATARSTVGHSSGVRGAEFTFWGEAALAGAVGVIQAGDSLASLLGTTANSVGWHVHTGQVRINNVVVVSGLPLLAKGEVASIAVDLAAGSPTIAFFRGSAQVHARALPAGTWHFAASLSAAVAGQLTMAVNAGQWQALTSAVLNGGWPAAAAVVAPVRLADSDWLSATTDTPANARFEGLLEGGSLGTIAELGFWPWSNDAPMQGGAAQVGVLDADGLLDALVQQDLSGVAVSVRVGDLDGTLAGATPVSRYVCDRIEVQGDGRKTLVLSDAHDDLDEPLTRGVFLPSIPALAWRPQPVVIGAVASVPALPVNRDGSVCWLADAPLSELSAVLDRGDAMEAGTWSLAPDTQQLLLSQPPVGPVVVDASSIGAGMQPATLEQALRQLFRRIGKASWSAADAAAIDVATGYGGIGFYTADTISVRQALAAILPSYGAWWWQAADGVLRFARVVDPVSVASGALAFDLDLDAEGVEPVLIADDAARLTRRMGYRPNARVLTASELVTDLVDVPPLRREELTSTFRAQVYSAVPLAARYAHADTAAPLVSCFWRAADAQAEIDRVCGLYSTPRCSYVLKTSGLSIAAPSPGQVGRITAGRHGLAAGKQVLVRRVERNPATGAINIVVWG